MSCGFVSFIGNDLLTRLIDEQCPKFDPQNRINEIKHFG